MKILIVDDSKAMRMIIARTLKQAGFDGHEILQAGNADEALTLLDGTKVDVVLSDWNMPGMNGLDFVRKLRETKSQIRFGFITSESTPAAREEATAAGADFFVSKPFTAEVFAAELKPVLA